MRISETAAIVTGGASGLGEATARHFREMGAEVTLLDRDADRGEAIAAEIGATFAETDVTSEASVAAATISRQVRASALSPVQATMRPRSKPSLTSVSMKASSFAAILATFSMW